MLKVKNVLTHNVFILLTECANIINYGNDMLYSTMRNCENNFIKENMFYSHCNIIIEERFSDYCTIQGLKFLIKTYHKSTAY